MKRFLKIILFGSARFISYVNQILFPESNFLMRKLLDEKNREVFEVFSKDLKKSIRHKDLTSIRKYAIELAKSNEKRLGKKESFFYLEFGVWKGKSSNFFSKYVNKLYCFDSFEGLPEEWEGVLPKGYFKLEKKLPKLKSNVELIIGYVEDTLDQFLKTKNPKINFVHMDMDLYHPTKFVLRKIKPYLQKGSIILFDELYNYINWKSGEYKALIEIFEESEYTYKSFNINSTQVLIQIL